MISENQIQDAKTFIELCQNGKVYKGSKPPNWLKVLAWLSVISLGVAFWYFVWQSVG